MANVATLAVKLEARDQLSGPLGKLSTKMDSVAARARTMGKAFAVVGGAITGLAVLSVKAASDLEESINAVSVVFGEAADSVLEFGRTAATTVGLSNAAFNQLAAQTGALLQDTALSMDQAAQATLDLSVRAADMASVMNTSVEDALSAVNQALRGETEAIRKFTGDVTDASLEQFRLAEGIQKAVKEMTQQEKRVLRVGLIMQQTAKFSGDFANTSDSLANSMRIAKAQMTDMAAEVGTALLPVMSAVVATMTKVLAGFRSWTKENPQLSRVIVLVVAGIGALLLVLAPLLIMLPALAAGVALLAGASGIGLLLIALTALVAGAVILWKNWDTVWTNIKKITESTANFLIDGFNKITFAQRSFIAGMLEGVQAVVDLASKVPGLGNKFDGLSDSIQSVIDKVRTGVGEIDITADAVQQMGKQAELADQAMQHFGETVADVAQDNVTATTSMKDHFGADWAAMTAVVQQNLDDQKMMHENAIAGRISSANTERERLKLVGASILADFVALQAAKSGVFSAGLSQLETMLYQHNQRVQDARNRQALAASGALAAFQNALNVPNLSIGANFLQNALSGAQQTRGITTSVRGGAPVHIDPALVAGVGAGTVGGNVQKIIELTVNMNAGTFEAQSEIIAAVRAGIEAGALTDELRELSASIQVVD